MKKLINIIFILILFLSCRNDLFVNIDAQKINDKTVKAKITTNFPENTVFSITAERIYKRKNNPNYYGGTYYFSRGLPVKNGIVEFSFEIDDKNWIDNYNEHREYENQLRPNKELTEIDYESIKDTIEISVFYKPRLERDYNVEKILGEKGKNIRGKGTIKIEDYKIFSKTIKFYSKFEQ